VSDAPELTRVPLLSATQAAEVASAVHALRDRWTSRHAECPFFTLGTASYLDGDQGFQGYREKAAATNPLLEEHFGDLLATVAGALAELLGAPCRYAPRLARPGFHVYLSSPAFRQAGRVHYDLQFEKIDWNGEPVDLEDQLSFTLPVRLPRAGAGLLVWKVDYREVRRTFPEVRRRILEENREPELHPYRVGELVAHPGYLLHQIAPMPDMEPDDQRITLQGHAARGEDGWILYW